MQEHNPSTEITEIEVHYRQRPKFFGDWHLPYLLRPGSISTVASLYGIAGLIGLLSLQQRAELEFYYLSSSVAIWLIIIVATFKRRNNTVQCRLSFDEKTGVINLFDYATADVYLIGKPFSSVLESDTELTIYKGTRQAFPIPKSLLTNQWQSRLLQVGNNLKPTVQQISITIFGLVYPIFIILLLNKVWFDILKLI